MTTRYKKGLFAGDSATLSVTEVAKTLYKTPALLTVWTRCGKANCQCNAGHLHGPYYALYWREGAVQRRRYVPARDLPVVQAVLEERRTQERIERLRHTQSLRVWRKLAHLAKEVEARMREERVEQ